MNNSNICVVPFPDSWLARTGFKIGVPVFSSPREDEKENELNVRWTATRMRKLGEMTEWC